MGGTGEYPNYENYTAANNYSETLRLVYDPTKTSFSDILDAYWQFLPIGSGCDDPAYCPRMFVVDDEQRKLASASINPSSA